MLSVENMQSDVISNTQKDTTFNFGASNFTTPDLDFRHAAAND